MTKCSVQGCRRLCRAPYTECQNHRPPPPPRDHGNRDPARELELQRIRRAKAKRNAFPAGWEYA